MGFTTEIQEVLFQWPTLECECRLDSISHGTMNSYNSCLPSHKGCLSSRFHFMCNGFVLWGENHGVKSEIFTTTTLPETSLINN